MNPQTIDELEARIAQLERENLLLQSHLDTANAAARLADLRYQDLQQASAAFLRKADYVHQHPAFKHVWTFFKNHGLVYQGPRYVNELHALRELTFPTSAVRAEAPEAQAQELRESGAL